MTNLKKNPDGIIILQVYVQVSLCIQVLPELPSRRGMFLFPPFCFPCYKRYFKKNTPDSAGLNILYEHSNI